MTTQPISSSCEAYALALSVQPRLYQRLAELHLSLDPIKKRALEALEEFVTRNHTLVITMTLANCVKFLREGAWLNIYEVAADRHDLLESLEGSIRQALHKAGVDWGERRFMIDNLLRFTHDTHYASMSFGGAPEPRYGHGECCVVLNLAEWEPRATCFAGDPLRVCFDQEGQRSLADPEVLELFAVASDWPKLLLAHYGNALIDSDSTIFVLDPLRMRGRLEDPNYMLEVHLHGKVTAAHTHRILISQAFFERCKSDVKNWERQQRKTTHALANAPLFEELLGLAHKRKINLSLPEAK
jgi:hypothetical protein